MRQEIKYGAVLYTVQLMRLTHVHMCTCSKEEKYIYILRERTHKKERKKRKTNMDNECMTFRNGRTIKVNAFVHHPSPAPFLKAVMT